MSVSHDVLFVAVSLDDVDVHWGLALGKEIVSLNSLELKLVDVVVNELSSLLGGSVGVEFSVEHGGEVGDFNELGESLDVPAGWQW